MGNPILVSVVVCTFNRADFLAKCLASLFKQENAPSFEIVVVDNNSTDATSKVVPEASAHTDIPIQYVFLEEMGLSRARNAGIRAAHGSIVAFIDDDAVAMPDWVKEIEHGFQLFPRAVAVGGAVEGDYEIPKPAWLASELVKVVSAGDLGPSPRLLSIGESVIGTNCAFRSEVFRQRGLFSTNLGRIGTSLLSSEEDEFCSRLHEHGDAIAYNPQMTVKHWVSRDRLTRSYFVRRMYWNGRSKARADFEGHKSVLVRGSGRLFLALPRDGIKMVLSFGKPDKHFLYESMLVKHTGYIREVLALEANRLPRGFKRRKASTCNAGVNLE